MKIDDNLLLGLEITEEQFKKLSDQERVSLLYRLNYLKQVSRFNKLPFFIPNGSQESWIKSLGTLSVRTRQNNKPKKIFINCAGNGVGKTGWLINVAGNIFYGIQSDWFKYPLFQNEWKYPKLGWYLSGHDTLQDKIVPELKKWLPKGRYELTKAGKTYESQLISDTGWTLLLKSYDQDPQQMESADVGLILLDEPPPKILWDALIARTRMGCIILFAMTPLYHSAWIKDELIDDPEKGKYTKVFYAENESNCRTHGIRGILPHEQIEFMESQYDEEQIEARKHGRFMHLIGTILKGWDPNYHEHKEPPSHFTQDKYDIYNLIDPHDRKPTAIAWFAIGKDDHAYCIDEYPHENFWSVKSTDKDYEFYAKKILEIEAINGWDSEMIYRFCDPNKGKTRIGATGDTVIETFLKHGLVFDVNVNDNLEDGHSAIRNIMKVINNRSGLTIWLGCTNMWNSVNKYAYSEASSKKTESDGLSEKVQQKYKDFADLLRYFAIAKFPYLGSQGAVKTQQDKSNADSGRTDVGQGHSGGWHHDWRNPFGKPTFS